MYESEVIKYLVADVERELALIEEYQLAVIEAKKKENGTDVGYWWRFINWDKPKPNKTRIKDDLKMLRRTSFDMEKKLNKIYIE